jgi:hypothetical protein
MAPAYRGGGGDHRAGRGSARWRTAGAISWLRVADLLEGASESELDEPLARSAAVLCRQAGADATAMEP